jgi:MFS family permease
MGFAVGPLLGGWAYSSHGFAFAFLVCGLAEIAVVLGSLAVIVPWRRRERTAVRK